MANLYAAFRRSFETAADRVLIETDRDRYTGTQLDAAVAAYAGALAAFGVAPGDRVAVQAEKSVELVFLYLACLQRGAVYLPLNTAYQPSELAYFLGDAEPRLFVVDPQRRAQLAELASANRSAPRARVNSPLPPRAQPRCIPSLSGATTTWPRSATPPVLPGAPRAR
jgi:malonyl-CoA/methylmalonyl-CoA synthetase